MLPEFPFAPLRPAAVLVLAVVAFHAPSARAVTPFVLKDIRIEGLQRTDPGTVFGALPFRIGDTYNDEKGASALRALFATGLFKDVRIEIEGEALANNHRYARAEGIVPAPEANHAVKGAIVEALRCKAEGRSEVILFNLCGHGHFDMTAYQNYFAGKLSDQSYDEAELAMALSGLPSVPA